MALREVKMEAFKLTDFVNQPVTGYYLGSKEIETDFGTSEVHEFFNAEKKSYFSFYGVTSLNLKLKAVPTGSLVQFTYKGKVQAKTKYGMRDVHDVVVAYDPDDNYLGSKVEEVIANSGTKAAVTPSPAVAPAPPAPVAPSNGKAKASIPDEDLPF